MALIFSVFALGVSLTALWMAVDARKAGSSDTEVMIRGALQPVRDSIDKVSAQFPPITKAHNGLVSELAEIELELAEIRRENAQLRLTMTQPQPQKESTKRPYA